jgi:predicted amidophosphoribosyltransferase
VLRPPADDLVHALKYEGWPELASTMGEAVQRLVTPDLGRPGTVVVPVPTTAERLRSRGYNQAELLARVVAERHRLPLRRALCRPDARGSQTALTPAERQANVRGAFASAPDFVGSIRGAPVLLVDDVLTTGATASEAAAVLAGMGARGVTLPAFARPLPRGP